MVVEAYVFEGVQHGFEFWYASGDPYGYGVPVVPWTHSTTLRFCVVSPLTLLRYCVFALVSSVAVLGDVELYWSACLVTSVMFSMLYGAMS